MFQHIHSFPTTLIIQTTIISYSDFCNKLTSISTSPFVPLYFYTHHPQLTMGLHLDKPNANWKYHKSSAFSIPNLLNILL